jgi:hypothetical protein
LVEYALSYLHIGAFVFNDNERITVVVVDDRVASFGESIVVDANLVGNTSEWSFEGFGDIDNSVLSHPFFRRKDKPFASY